MVWLRRDPQTGEYGARKFETADGEFTTVVAPFNDTTEGVEWAQVKPDWITNHGTVLVFLGNTGKEDTFLGKHGCDDVKGISAYLNKRFWEFPEGVRVHVQELRSSKRDHWPRSYDEASSGSPKGQIDRRWNRRRIRGARYFVQYPKPLQDGKFDSVESVALSDGTTVDCYLWEGQRPKVHSYAQMNGYIAALYGGELYDVQKHASEMRRFGITQAALRANVTLIICPPALKQGVGVYPDTARSSLKIMGSKDAGSSLPWAQWGEEFAYNMPDALKRAIIESTTSNAGSLDDKKWRKRFIDRFGKRWKELKRVLNPNGNTTVDVDQPGESQGHATPKPKKKSSKPGGEGAAAGELARGRKPGKKKASKKRVQAGLPNYDWVNEEDVGAGLAAVWMKTSPAHPNGVVLLNRQFPAFVEIVKHWQSHYPDVMSERVREVIESVYGQTMVARIAHSETLCKDPNWGRERVETELRSPEALTMAALGRGNRNRAVGECAGSVGRADRNLVGHGCGHLPRLHLHGNGRVRLANVWRGTICGTRRCDAGDPTARGW